MSFPCKFWILQALLVEKLAIMNLKLAQIVGNVLVLSQPHAYVPEDTHTHMQFALTDIHPHITNPWNKFHELLRNGYFLIKISYFTTRKVGASVPPSASLIHVKKKERNLKAETNQAL